MTAPGSGDIELARGAGNLDTFTRPVLDKELGSEFGWYDRLFFGWRDGKVFDYGDWEARDMAEMMNKDYKARQIENVLTLPIVSATYSVTPAKGDKGEAEWTQAFFDSDPLGDGCDTPLRLILNQMTSAFTYRRAFFEKVWTEGTGQFAGKTVYGKLGWRSQTTCRLMRDAKTGKFAGFEQENYYSGPDMSRQNIWPVQIKPQNAFVYVHGTWRDPINGTSELDVAYWAYKTKQKIMFLWFQFLEGVALPRTIVKGQDEGATNEAARNIAKLRNSGVLPVFSPSGPTGIDVTSLDLSGKGASQFSAAITWLDQCATNSVLAGFLDLTGQATGAATGSPRGSNALSEDASDFFLQTREADAAEMATAIRTDVFAPLVRYNFGKDAAVPYLSFEPLNTEDKSTSVTMLSDLMRSRDPALIPDEFIGELAQQVADYLGMDGVKVRDAFNSKAAEVARQAAAQNQQRLALGPAAAAAGISMPGFGVQPLPPKGAAPTAATTPVPATASHLSGIAAAVTQAHHAVKGAAAIAAGQAPTRRQASALNALQSGGKA